MFYSEYVLTKKGPYAKIWLAAHLDNKLTKSQIAETNIRQSVDSIATPVVPIALRTSGHLLLGVVKIYRRKVKYVVNECNETMTRIKLQVVSHTKVDLPEKSSLATLAQITMPDKLTDLEMMLPDVDLQALTSGVQVHTSHFRKLVDDLDEWYTEDTPVESSPGPFTQTQDEISLGSLDRARREERSIHETIVDLPPIDLDLGIDLGLTPTSHLRKTPSTTTTGEVPYMAELPDIPELIEREQAAPLSEPRRTLNTIAPSRKRKRAVIIDDPTEIPNHQFQEILKDTKDLKRRRQNVLTETFEVTKQLGTKEIFEIPASFETMPENILSFFKKGFKTFEENISEISSQVSRAREAQAISDFELPPHMDIEDIPPIDFETSSIGKAPIPESPESDFATHMQLPQSAQPSRIGELEMQLKTPLSIKGLESQTITTVAILMDAFEKNDQIKVLELIKDSNKLTAAQIFYQVLLLKTRGFINTNQTSPLGEIEITKTTKFSELSVSV